jgi:alpha-tubulin suppressor-like RCC1 family protein
MTRSRAAALLCATVLAGVLAISSSPPAAQAEAGEGAPGTPRLEATAVAAGEYFTCALVASGAVRCWGDSDRGQLAQGNENSVGDDPGESTVAVPLPGPVRTVAAGYGTACAILDSGELRCWGSGTSGALATGNQLDVGDDPGETPVRIDLGPGRTATAVTLGSNNACAILDTGQVRCWGSGSYGMLGQGNMTAIGDDPGEAPLPVTLPRPAVAIAASWSSVCAVLDDGRLFCWGGGPHGQLMQGNTDNHGDQFGELPVPVNTGGHAVLAITSGADFYCAVYDDHQVRCWGDNTYGQLARGSTADFGDSPGETNVGPIALPAGRSAVAVSAGAYHACALLDDGQLRCWGQGDNGALGQGSTQTLGDQPGESTTGVDLGGAARVLVGGGYVTCAVAATGMRCWGWNDGGQLGQGSQVPNYGTALGEVPRMLPPIALGGESVGRDTDHDGVRDAADSCPGVAGGKADGCPEATLKGRKVTLDVVLSKTRASAKCPRTAEVTVKTKGKHGRLTVRKTLRTKADPGGCRVTGKVRLPAKPLKKAGVKVKVAGKKLKTRHLIAVRP